MIKWQIINGKITTVLVLNFFLKRALKCTIFYWKTLKMLWLFIAMQAKEGLELLLAAIFSSVDIWIKLRMQSLIMDGKDSKMVKGSLNLLNWGIYFIFKMP